MTQEEFWNHVYDLVDTFTEAVDPDEDIPVRVVPETPSAVPAAYLVCACLAMRGFQFVVVEAANGLENDLYVAVHEGVDYPWLEQSHSVKESNNA
jgi:hypothetical protein